MISLSRWLNRFLGSASLLVAMAFGLFSGGIGMAATPDRLVAGFEAPPAETRVRTFWHWMNGNVTREGITLDLEAMQRVGVGGVMIFDGSTYLPAGPAGYLDPIWRGLMTHAMQEGDRLGIDIGMHNAPGWSSSGGPWITPELAMQQLVWTETTVAGGGVVEVVLRQPQTNLGFYCDAAVVAFPAMEGEERNYEDALARVTVGGGREVEKAVLSDGQWSTAVHYDAGEPVTWEFDHKVTLYGLTMQPAPGRRTSTLAIEVSLDGETFQAVGLVSHPGGHGIAAPAVRAWPPVKARWVRLVPKAAGAMGEVVWQRAPRVDDWPSKANFDYRVAGELRLGGDAAAMAAVDPSRVIDLTSYVADGRLRWPAPAGAWTILRIGYTPTGKQNVAASAAGTGLECDKFNAAATDFHFEHVVAKVQADAQAVGASGPATLTIDSYEAGMQNWTADFAAEFERQTGYAITPFFPALFGRVVGDRGRTERFLFDFRRVQAELMASRYYGRMQERAREHGMRFFVEGYGPGAFDELQVAGSPEVPMTEFWAHTPWTPNRTVKMVSSAAHVYGKNVVAAESFTGESETSRWLNYPYALKVLGDEMMAQGVNEIVFHRYAHQPHPTAVPGMAMGPYGFNFDRTNTWFEQSKVWLAYLQRCQFMLRQGVPVADVLYFTGERSPNSSQYALPVLPPGYTYDLVNADVLLHRMAVQDGAWVLPEGGRYRLLVLPPDLTTMTPALARRLAELAGQGAQIVGPSPQFSPTLVGWPESERAMLSDVAAMWARPNVRAETDIGAALEKLGVTPDFSFIAGAADASMSWSHRRLEDGDLCFVANRQRRVEPVVVSLRGMAGREVEIWSPEAGTRSVAALATDRGDRLELPLRLEAAESVFVRIKDAPRGVRPTGLYRDGELVDGTGRRGPDSVDTTRDFTMAMWVKPDTNLRVMPTESVTGRIDEVGKFYAIAADPGDARFGPGHATAGLAVGRNGIYVIERSINTAPAVLVARMPISGWTHVAVRYEAGVPELYVNGVWIRRGLKSGKIVHSGGGAPPPPVDYTLHFPGIQAITREAGREPPPSRGMVYTFDGNFGPAQTFGKALGRSEIAALAAAGAPAPELPEVSALSRRPDGATEFLAWRSGTYALDVGSTARRAVGVAPAETLEGAWDVAFQPGRAAPERITLPELESLHRNDDPGVKYFSGTATYSKRWHSSGIADGARVVLDLGRVEVIAEVKVNGRAAGVVWKEPYRLDITDLVAAGDNQLEIAVTDLWTNRLIGDEHLPVEDEFGLRDEQGADPHGIVRLPDWYLNGEPKPPGGRTTFATWQFYDADEPLVASGLLGPVRILQPVRVVLPD